MLCGFAKQVNIEAAYIHIIDINITVFISKTLNTQFKYHKILNKNKVLILKFHDSISIKYSFYITNELLPL